MRLLPDTLFGRLFLAVCLPMAVSLAISVALLARDRQVLAQQLSGANATRQRIAALAPQLAGLALADRSAAMSRINAEALPVSGRERELARADTAARLRAGTRALRRVDDTYTRPLGAELGAGCRVAAARAAPWVTDFVDLARAPARDDEFSTADLDPAQVFEFGRNRTGRAPGESAGPPGAGAPGAGVNDLEARREWSGRNLYDLAVSCGDSAPVLFRVPAPPEAPSLDTRLTWELFLLGALLALALYVAVRLTTRPLAQLSVAAERVGRADPAPPLPESGAREVRESLRAFNIMQLRLRRYLDSRTAVLAAMSHDLRTPLTRLRLRAESLDDAVARERLVRDIEEMDSLVSRSLSLFRGLSDQEKPELADLDQLLATLAEEFRELGHVVPLRGRAGAPLALRPLALKRALRNLVENAIKYGEGAEVEVRDGERVSIFVRDHGPGIPEGKLQAVLEPFRRLEGSRNRDTGGIGLGLSIARDVAEAHGGTLALANLQGGGLEARLELPRTVG